MKSTTMTVPVVGLELGLQHERAGPIASTDVPRRLGGRHQPAAMLGLPSSAAKQAPESNRGQHSQSIEPSRPTSAAVSQSPISA